MYVLDDAFLGFQQIVEHGARRSLRQGQRFTTKGRQGFAMEKLLDALSTVVSLKNVIW